MSDFIKWGAAFVVMGGVLLAMGGSEKYGEIGASLAVVIAIGTLTWKGPQAAVNFDALFGTNLAGKK